MHFTCIYHGMPSLVFYLGTPHISVCEDVLPQAPLSHRKDVALLVDLLSHLPHRPVRVPHQNASTQSSCRISLAAPQAPAPGRSGEDSEGEEKVGGCEDSRYFATFPNRSRD